MDSIVLKQLPNKIKEGHAVVKVDPTSSEKKTASGIIIPGATAFMRGEIVKAHKLETYDVGDEVYFRKETGTNLTINGEDYILTVERDFYLAV